MALLVTAQIRRVVCAARPLLLLLFIAFCLAACKRSSVEDEDILNDFAWRKDATGNEIATSRSDTSLNFFVVGDLSYYSLYLVEQYVGQVSDAAGLRLERSPTKSSTLAIVHDTKVFSRLKNDKSAFAPLGLTENMLASIESQVTSDTPKCITWTLTENSGDIITTIALLNEKFDGCLLSGILNSFGVKAANVNVRTLLDVCVLYEGRRLGLRTRQSLAMEMPKLRNLCLTKMANH